MENPFSQKNTVNKCVSFYFQKCIEKMVKQYNQFSVINCSSVIQIIIQHTTFLGDPDHNTTHRFSCSICHNLKHRSVRPHIKKMQVKITHTVLVTLIYFLLLSLVSSHFVIVGHIYVPIYNSSQLSGTCYCAVGISCMEILCIWL